MQQPPNYRPRGHGIQIIVNWSGEAEEAIVRLWIS